MHLLVVIFIHMEANLIFRAPPHTVSMGIPAPDEFPPPFHAYCGLASMPFLWTERGRMGWPDRTGMYRKSSQRTGLTLMMEKCASAK